MRGVDGARRGGVGAGPNLRWAVDKDAAKREVGGGPDLHTARIGGKHRSAEVSGADEGHHATLAQPQRRAVQPSILPEQLPRRFVVFGNPVAIRAPDRTDCDASLHQPADELLAEDAETVTPPGRFRGMKVGKVGWYPPYSSLALSMMV